MWIQGNTGAKCLLRRHRTRCIFLGWVNLGSRPKRAHPSVPIYRNILSIEYVVVWYCFGIEIFPTPKLWFQIASKPPFLEGYPTWRSTCAYRQNFHYPKCAGSLFGAGHFELISAPLCFRNLSEAGKWLHDHWSRILYHVPWPLRVYFGLTQIERWILCSIALLCIIR